ncbi:MAG: hypothetical protein ABI120_03415 [Gemmatimonadaceae bacterium]
MTLVLLMAFGMVANAQTVVLTAPTTAQLPNLTPRFTVRALGFPVGAGPLQYTVFITRNSTGDGPFVETISTTSSDTIVNLLVSRLLPDTATVYWKARVVSPNGAITESQISSARRAPKWLTLLYPNSELGDQDTTRTPTFRWESGALDPEFGAWSYTIEILLNNRAEQTKAGFAEMFYKSQPLRANTPYQWQLTASVARSGESVTQRNSKTFSISDPALPTTTLLYQNFPNPFPSAVAFATCFWFDVQTGGSRVSLDIVDLRGSLVKTIIPPTALEGGVYGRGPVGSASNCDNRYVWNGTAADGRSVPGGVYLARFNATGLRTSFKKIVFKGR